MRNKAAVNQLNRSLLLVGLLVCGPVTGQDNDSYFNESTSTSAAFSKIERVQYDLSEEEVSRVRRLRILDRSYGVNDLSAVELLGKYAKTHTDRMKYARKHVTAMTDNVGRSQAWGFAVYEATQESNLVGTVLNANPTIESGLNRLRMAVPRTNYSDFTTNPPMKRSDPGRVLMMTTDCGEVCDGVFAAEFVMVMENKVDHIDVVFVNSGEKDTADIFDWAKSMAISKEVLESGKVNLHMDDEAFRAMRAGRDNVPRLIRKSE